MCLVSHWYPNRCWLAAPCEPRAEEGRRFRRYLDVVSTARDLSPVTRRRALTTLAVGVFAPNVLAACFGGSTKQAEKAKPPAEATITFACLAMTGAVVSLTVTVKVEVLVLFEGSVAVMVTVVTPIGNTVPLFFE